MLQGENDVLDIGWLQPELSHFVDDVSTEVDGSA